VSQIELFPAAAELPEGFVYAARFISAAEEEGLMKVMEELPFAEIKMHGVVAKRRAAHFGRGYEYNSGRLAGALPIPETFLPLRKRVAGFARRTPEEFAELLVTDYPPGAGIGWHRDAPPFEIIVGVSLLSDCTMQFRPWPVQPADGRRRKPLQQVLERRSAYLISGVSRTAWQHHIAESKARRISLTFRTLRARAR